MLSKAVYINGLGIISPVGIEREALLAARPPSFSERVVKCVTPDYTGIIEANSLRRMNRMLKMSIFTAKQCLFDSNVSVPDAIITGTGLGCTEDTEKFLKGTLTEEGGILSPTSFIHSTHNTISSQVAIALNCTGYNSTYVHRAFSFESALLDAILQLSESDSSSGKNILVGGADEVTPSVFKIMDELGFWKKKVQEGNFFNSETAGATAAGEGVSFFMLSGKASVNSYAVLKGLKMINTSDVSIVKSSLHSFLEENDLNSESIDLLLLGINGDERYDLFYDETLRTFSEITVAGFKNLCGEYFTASSFGLGIASLAIAEGKIPTDSILRRGKSSIKNVLIYNQYKGRNHSFYLLSDVKV